MLSICLPIQYISQEPQLTPPQRNHYVNQPGVHKIEHVRVRIGTLLLGKIITK